MNNYSITFKSLRAGTVYTLNIGGGTGAAIPLKGGAQPFTTQEDDSDDMFTPIRTQTGYIRIVDDGLDARTPAQAFNWKDLLPATDTSRPVTLTGVDAQGNSLGTLWQGFMQAQNFGGVLYGNPQEREFPVQCPLTILEGTDINYQHTSIENFAYLLQRVVNTIDVESGGTENSSGVITANGSIHITNIYVQGSADAQEWLLKRIDWQNFCDIDGDGVLIARYNLYQILEDVCRFWGWTARTHGQDLYLTCADDSSEQTWLTMTRAQLDTMAGGSTAGTTGGAFDTVTLSGDIFANTNQDDYQLRGPNKATVTADGNTGNDEIIRIFPNSFVQEMTDGGTYLASGGGFGPVTNALRYTTDKTSFNTPLLEGSCRSGYATFNVMSFLDDAGNTQSFNVVKIKKSYASGATAFASLITKYEHVYSGDVITISGVVYRGGKKFEDKNSAGVGQKHMYIRLGVGKTRSTASWYVSGGRTPTWSNTPTDIQVTIGGDNADLIQMSMQAQCSGKVFLELVGSNDLSAIDGERSFDLADLIMKVERSNKYYEVTTNQYGNFASLKTKELSDSREYNSTNGNNVRQDWNADCIYASDNDMNFGFGVIANADDSYMTGFNYGGFGLLTRPEQHLANRVTAFWATSKRKLAVELRNDQISAVTPMKKTTLDGTTGYPIAISHDWRDDITQLTIIQL